MARIVGTLLLSIAILSLFLLIFSPNGEAWVSGEITIKARDSMRYNVTKVVTPSKEVHIRIAESTAPINIFIYENQSYGPPEKYFWNKENVTEGYWKIELPYHGGWIIEIQNEQDFSTRVHIEMFGPSMGDDTSDPIANSFICCLMCVAFVGGILIMWMILFNRRKKRELNFR